MNFVKPGLLVLSLICLCGALRYRNGNTALTAAGTMLLFAGALA